METGPLAARRRILSRRAGRHTATRRTNSAVEVNGDGTRNRPARQTSSCPGGKVTGGAAGSSGWPQCGQTRSAGCTSAPQRRHRGTRSTSWRRQCVQNGLPGSVSRLQWGHDAVPGEAGRSVGGGGGSEAATTAGGEPCSQRATGSLRSASNNRTPQPRARRPGWTGPPVHPQAVVPLYGRMFSGLSLACTMPLGRSVARSLRRFVGLRHSEDAKFIGCTKKQARGSPSARRATRLGLDRSTRRTSLSC